VSEFPESWSWPTPRQLITVAFVFAVAARELDIFDGLYGKLVGMFVLALGLLGFQVNKQYQSDRVKSILKEHDPCPHPKPGETF